MPAGRIPQPSQLRLLKGRAEGRDSGNRVVNEGPKFDRGSPPVPEWLPPAARTEWRRVCPLLEKYDLLKPLDMAALTAYCMAWSRYVDSVASLERYGAIAHGRRTAAVMEYDSAVKDLRDWCNQFGLTPVAEQKLAAPKVDAPDDPFSAS